MSKASLVVLISGSGSNLQAIINAIINQELDAEIKAVICNKPETRGLQRAAEAGIETFVLKHQDFPDRESFDMAMIDIIDKTAPDLVILAGFMRILSERFIDHYHQRLLNIHPSLLPRYKGLNTHQQAIDSHDSCHGASVHYVSHELDSGPVVIQAEVPVLASDDSETLAARVLVEEHKIYPLAIRLHCQKRLGFDTQGQLCFDGDVLEKPLRWKNNKLLT